MATDLTTLGIGVNSEGVKVAEKDLKDMAAAAKQAEKDASSFEKQMASATTKGVVFGTMIADAAFKVLDLAGKFLELGISIKKYQDLATQTGSDPAGLAALQITADVASVSIDNIALSMARLSSRLLRSKEDSGIVSKAVKDLGLNFNELKRMNPDEMYRTIAVAMEGVASGSERVAIAQGLFGLNGAVQLRVMHELATQGEKNNILTNEQIGLAERTHSSITRTTSTIHQFAQAFMANANPAIETVAKSLQELVEEMLGVDSAGNRLKANNGMRDWAIEAAKELTYLLDALVMVKRMFAGVGSGVAAFAASMEIKTDSQGNEPSYSWNPFGKVPFDKWLKSSTEVRDKRLAFIKDALKEEDLLGALPGQKLRDRLDKTLEEAHAADAARSANDFPGRPGPKNRPPNEAEEEVDGYEKIRLAIERKNEAQKMENQLNRELTVFEKTEIEMKAQLESMMRAEDERRKKAGKPLLNEQETQGLYFQMELSARIVAKNKEREESEKAAAKAADLATKEREKATAALNKEADANEKSVQSLLEQTNAVGKTKAEIESLAVTRLLDEAATKAQNISISETTRNEVDHADAARAVVKSLIDRASATSAYSVALETQARIEKNLQDTKRTEREIADAQRMLETYGMTREEIRRYETAQRRRIAVEELLLTKSDESSFTVDKESDSIRRKALAVLEVTDRELALAALQDRDRADPMVGASRAMKRYIEDAKDVARSTEEVVSHVAKGIEDNLIAGIMHGKMAWEDLISYMIQEALRLQVIKPMIAGLFSGGDSGGGLLGMILGMGGGGDGGADAGTSLVATMTGTGHGAKGAVIDSSMPAGQEGLKFARGGIVDSPTTFKFSAGGSVQSGLMGEAGPEGILPLERGPGGKLGVHASGAGGQVTVNVTHNNTFGTGVSPSQLAQALAQNKRQTISEVSDQMRRGSLAFTR